ncbi:MULTISPECIES: dynamin family protein [unclassified Campylobacter]|uniref:dynamin family protein n=1 Tax=unclassified Campylobacter TaxID=2593542 RepID=UPI0022E9F672|nr:MULTISPECIES: dynamin family protein [unclassified Campylobacter]MDA3054960.1 dynamin family protein [Campylobacter sp. VBCF_07 NA4]MDA3060462.1 dynamin family protein [Campylobacter sp. VBCF_02 NA5]MDA3070272.1 dynamin family protein [Campylobacter sp. VBCF_08 NA3]WBR54703.1 dynamin family protein [Campylobacter sp. VBCF_01 NA2]
MNNFMSKIWGSKRLFIDESLTRTMPSDIAALMLCTNSQNFEKFKSLQSFREILKELGEEIGIYAIQSLQIGAINAICKLKISKLSVLMMVENLSKEGIISKSEYDEISKFLLQLQSDLSENEAPNSPANFAFYGKLESLDIISDELKALLSAKSEDELANLVSGTDTGAGANLGANLGARSNTSASENTSENSDTNPGAGFLVCASEFENSLFERTNAAKLNAKDANFTLSVTGVINAGKSSMLNRLLGFDILGTSNIPETANLTLLKGSDKPYAKVKFYDDEELEILGFAQEFRSKFQNQSEAIIEPEKLQEFTSAKYEISKFIKFIELGIKSDFLSDKITVVDTPGLDDSVVLREELTKNFMFSSDAIIHLMNASQSSTKKDMSFIASTLKSSKNNSLIVVLTHADLLSQTELIDALRYARASICEELGAFGFDEGLIENVSYFCIDSHSGRGIGELKSHLFERFFGENSAKADEILSSYKKELSLICEAYLADLQEQNADFSANKSELAQKCENINAEISALNANLAKLKNDLTGAISKLSYDDSTLFAPLKSAILTIKDRVLTDINYSKKNKKQIDFSRLEVIANSGVKDVITDIFRSFSQKISRDISDIKELLGSDFSEVNSLKFDTKKYMDENFAQPNFAKFNESLREIVRKNSDFGALSASFDALFSEFFAKLNLKSSFENIAKTCTAEFKENVLALFASKKSSLDLRQSELESALKAGDENAEQIAKNARLVREKINLVNGLIKRIEQC